MSSSRMRVQPRYGRVVALAAAASTTLVSVLGTLGTSSADDSGSPRTGSRIALAASSAALATAPSTGLRASLSVGLAAAESQGAPAVPAPAAPTPSPGAAATTTPSAPSVSGAEAVPPPPRRSGTRRRVVFDESEQRVWLVDARDRVARTYLVSGSVYDNLDPGSYEVYSRSATATGIDGSELRWMVRFTQGENAAIGFHWIPRLDGQPMQTRAELGTPLSHGCIRQATPDARALWRFAPVGTPVVVTA